MQRFNPECLITHDCIDEFYPIALPSGSNWTLSYGTTSAKAQLFALWNYSRSCHSMRRELSFLEHSRSHSTQSTPYNHASWNRLLFAKRQRGMFRLHVGCENTQWTSAILSPVHKDLARLNGPPQPNQKWSPALGIEPRCLDHKPQPLTIESFLTPVLGDVGFKSAKGRYHAVLELGRDGNRRTRPSYY